MVNSVSTFQEAHRRRINDQARLVTDGDLLSVVIAHNDEAAIRRAAVALSMGYSSADVADALPARIEQLS